MAIGADDVHFDFAGSVAAKDGAVLDEDHAGTVSGRREGGADAGKTAASDEKITV